MFLIGLFQRSLFCVRAGWSVLLVTALILSSSFAFAFHPFEDLSRPRNKIGNVEVTALIDPILAKPGETFHLHLLVRLSPGWHIYSLKAQGGDESLATQIHFEENVFQATGEWMEPKPAIILDEALDKVVKVHNGSVQFRRNLLVPGDLNPGTFTISGKIEFRACDNKICSLPRKFGFQTQLRVSGDDDGL